MVLCADGRMHVVGSSPLQSREPADEEGTFPLGNSDCHPEKASLPEGGSEVPAEHRAAWVWVWVWV